MATYYVRPGGGDGNSGTSWAQAFATFQHLLDTLTAGDVGVVCGVLVQSAAPTITNSGTSTSPITVIGGHPTNGTIDGSLGWVDANNAAAKCLTDNAVVRSNYRWINLGFKRATGDGVHVDSASSHGHRWHNCTFEDNGGRGLVCDGRYSHAVACEATGNGSHGIYGGINVAECVAVGNSGSGVILLPDYRNVCAVGVLAHANGGHGIHVANQNNDNCCGVAVRGCTCDGNGQGGVYIAQANASWMVDVADCLLTNNGEYGVQCNEAGGLPTVRRNHLHNNTSGETNNIDGTDGIAAEQTTGDPLYVDRAGDDFRIERGSPAIRSDHAWAGAEPPVGLGGISRSRVVGGV